MPTTTMLPGHLQGTMKKPQKQAQPEDLTSVTYIEDDASFSIFPLKEVPQVRLSSPSSSPSHISAPHNDINESDSDSSSDDSSESSDSSDDFMQEDFDLDEASEIISHVNPSVATSQASPDENVDWNAASSKLSFQQQEAVLGDMVRNLTMKMAQHQKKNERYAELFSKLDDTQEHIHSLNQRAKVLEAALVIQDVADISYSGRTKKILASEADSVIQDVTSLSERTSRTVPIAEPPRPPLDTSLSWRTRGVVSSGEARPPLGDKQRSVPSLSGRASRSTPTAKPRPTLGNRQQSVPSLSGRTSRTVPNAESRPPVGDRQRSSTERSSPRAQRAAPVATSSPSRSKQQEKPLVTKHASSVQAAPPTRRVQSEESSTSMVVALAGQTSSPRRKMVRKVRRVRREKTEPMEFDLRSPCKETREDDEAAFQVQLPEFVSPTSSKRSSSKETVKNDIPLVLEIPFPAEELVAPVTVKSPSAQDINVDPVTPVPSSVRRRPAVNHSANRVVMVVADYRKSNDLKKTRSLRNFVSPVTPVSSSTRRLPTMHQSANRVVGVGNDRDSKVLSKTSSVRSFLAKSKKVLSNRCLGSDADGGFLAVSEKNIQEGMQASFFGLDDFNDLARRNSTDMVNRNKVKTGIVIPPPPVWTQSDFYKSNPETKAPLFDIGDSDTDDENCSGRNSSGSDLPLLG